MSEDTDDVDDSRAWKHRHESNVEGGFADLRADLAEQATERTHRLQAAESESDSDQ